MNKPTRKKIRLANYDYSSKGYYFITICIKDGHSLLGEICEQQIVLNEYGLVVKSEIENIHKVRAECKIHNYTIMPNHLHLLVQIVGDDGNRPVPPEGVYPPSAEPRADCQPLGEPRADCQPLGEPRADCHPPLRRTVPNMIQGFKGAVTRKIGFSIWQRSYHDHIVRNEAEYRRIWLYIDENPKRWAEDCYYK